MFQLYAKDTTYFEACMKFFESLFTQWAEAGAAHLVTFVLATRVWYPDITADTDLSALPQEERCASLVLWA